MEKLNRELRSRRTLPPPHMDIYSSTVRWSQLPPFFDPGAVNLSTNRRIGGGFLAPTAPALAHVSSGIRRPISLGGVAAYWRFPLRR